MPGESDLSARATRREVAADAGEISEALSRVDAAELGERLRKVRVAAGLTQTGLAEGLVSKAYLSRIESGSRRPKLALLREILAEFRVVHGSRYLSCSLQRWQSSFRSPIGALPSHWANSSRASSLRPSFARHSPSR